MPTPKGDLRRKGVGKKKAEELLAPASNEKEMFDIVKYQYQSIFGDAWKNNMKENGTLLWMSDKLIPWEELDYVKEMFDA